MHAANDLDVGTMTVPPASLLSRATHGNAVASRANPPYRESLPIDRGSSTGGSTLARPAATPPELIAHPQ
jgi:hypothetical protein